MIVAIIILVGTAVAVIMATVYAVLRTLKRRRTQAMMERLEPYRVGSQVDQTLRRRIERERSLVRFVPRFLRVRLAQANIEMSYKLVVVSGSAASTLFALGFMMLGPIEALVLVAAAAFGVWLAVLITAKKRLQALVDDLPGLLDRTRQLLITGNSMEMALSRATDGAGISVARYFGPTLRRVRNGAPLSESLGAMAARLDIPELHMLAAAVQTNLRYGGRMAPILRNLVNIFRDKSRVKRELKAATSEVRMSGVILGILPFATAGLIVALNPNYIDFFLYTDTGHTLLTIAGVMDVIGIILMRRIIKIDF